MLALAHHVAPVGFHVSGFVTFLIGVIVGGGGFAVIVHRK